MLKQTRLSYSAAIVLSVLLGILSRSADSIPLFFGDVLYAVMAYFGYRWVFIQGNDFQKIAYPLLFCYLIECQQLSELPWLVGLRNTTLGHYALGQGFLWIDLVCYTLGVIIAFCLDALLFLKNEKSLP